VGCQRGESLPPGPGRHFRLGHFAGNVINQRALLTLSGNNRRLSRRAPLEESFPAVDVEKAARLFTAVARGTGTFQKRLDLSREIDFLHIGWLLQGGRLWRGGGLARGGSDWQNLRQCQHRPACGRRRYPRIAVVRETAV